MEEGMMEASQEAPVQQAVSPAEPAPKPAPEQAGHDELDFFDEAVSEAELRGETPDGEAHGQDRTETPAPKEPKPETKPGDEPTGGDTSPGEDTSADGAKPPKGFVPHAALSEERTKRKEAQQRVEQLEQELAARKATHEQREMPEAPKDASEAARRFAEQNPQYAALVFEDSRDGELLRDKLDTYGEEDAIVLAKTLYVERELAEQKRRESGSADAAFLGTCVREMDAMFEGGLNGQQAKELIGYLQNEAGPAAGWPPRATTAVSTSTGRATRSPTPSTPARGGSRISAGGRWRSWGCSRMPIPSPPLPARNASGNPLRPKSPRR